MGTITYSNPESSEGVIEIVTPKEEESSVEVEKSQMQNPEELE